MGNRARLNYSQGDFQVEAAAISASRTHAAERLAASE